MKLGNKYSSCECMVLLKVCLRSEVIGPGQGQNFLHEAVSLY